MAAAAQEKKQLGKQLGKKLRKKAIKLKPLKLGLRTVKQWVGEDILILGYGEPFPYSVIAMNKVKTLEVQKQDIMGLMNPKFVKGLIYVAQNKA